MSLFAISSLILFISSLGFGLFVYLSDRKSESNLWWFSVSIATALWGLGLWGVTDSREYSDALLWQYLLDIGALLIPVLYLNYILSFLKIRSYGLRIFNTLLGLALVMFSFSSYFKSGLTQHFGFYWIDPGQAYIVFPIYFTVFVVISITLLLIYYAKNSDPTLKKQIQFTLLAGLAGFGGGITNFFPQLFDIYPFGNYFVIAYIILMSYSVLKHRLFNIKVIATQLLIFTLWLLLLIRLFSSTTLQDRLVGVVILAATIFIGILLIRSVLKEVKTRETMEALAKELAIANERLTMLDRQKSEFLSIASHQLRSPLTAIKGYSSMMLEGSFGKVTEPKLREAIERVFLSSERLVIIIEDFLNVSRIEQGRMQYEFSSVKLDKLVEEVIGDLGPSIKEAGLTISFVKKQEGDYYITADYGKIKQVVTNIIDNAMKYTPKGGITVTLDKDDDTRKILLVITDTGIGISREVLPMLFQKFTRAKGAGLINIQGTGLGLYVVKELMKANKGNVWVDSPGEGKGSTFYLEFMAE